MSWSPGFAIEDMPPRFNAASFKGDEAEIVDHFNAILPLLLEHVVNFAAANGLLDFAEKEVKTKGPACEEMRWKLVAARDATMSIYHFKMTLEAIHDGIKRCLTLMPYLDRPRLEKALESFCEQFPSLKDARDAVAHAAEEVATPTKLRRNFGSGAIDTPDVTIPNMANVYMSNNLIGRTLYATHRRKTLKVEITGAALDQLTEITRAVYAAFRPIETFVRERDTAQSRGG